MNQAGRVQGNRGSVARIGDTRAANGLLARAVTMLEVSFRCLRRANGACEQYS